MLQQTVGYRHLQPLKNAYTSYVFTYGGKMYIYFHHVFTFKN